MSVENPIKPPQTQKPPLSYIPQGVTHIDWSEVHPTTPELDEHDLELHAKSLGILGTQSYEAAQAAMKAEIKQQEEKESLNKKDLKEVIARLEEKRIKWEHELSSESIEDVKDTSHTEKNKHSEVHSHTEAHAHSGGNGHGHKEHKKWKDQSTAEKAQTVAKWTAYTGLGVGAVSLAFITGLSGVLVAGGFFAYVAYVLWDEGKKILGKPGGGSSGGGAKKAPSGGGQHSGGH